jgi:2-alkyl-3-oxoalkanoate reductase
MKVAVTGAGGFLGRALIKKLLDSGHEPLALVKKESYAAELRQSGIDAYARDLSIADDCQNLFREYDAIVHCAALTRDFGHWDEFNRYNIVTTKNMLDQAQKAEVGRFIHISTTAVYGNERNHFGTDEDANYGQQVVDPYTRSKIISDQDVIDFLEETEMPGVILRFGNIWGPGDPNVLPYMVDGLKKKRLVIEGGGDNVLSLTFIENAVEAVMLALAKEERQSLIYNITDGMKVTSKKFIEDIISVLRIKYTLRDVPYPILYSLAYFFERYYLFTRRQAKPPLTRFGARILKYHAVFDISRAMIELGYRPIVSYKDAMTLSSSYIKSLYFG